MKEKFNWNRILQGETVIHCNTKEKAIELLKEAGAKGFKWRSGISYSEETDFYTYGKDTCYDLINGTYRPLHFYNTLVYTILSYDEVLLSNEDLVRTPLNNVVCYHKKRNKYIKGKLEDRGKQGFVFSPDAGGYEMCNPTLNDIFI